MENENTFNEQEVKERISDEVRTELSEMGARILEQDEVGGRDMCRLVNKFKNAKIDYDKECDRINNRYKEDIANEKIKVLDYDFKLDKASYKEEIDKTIDAEKQRRLAEAQRLQADKDYKEAKNEAIKMLCMLKGAGVDITDEIFMDTINPLIGAKDTKALGIARLLAGNKVNEYLVDKSVDTINNYFTNSDLAAFGQSAKEFINTGEAELTLSLYMNKFENILRGDK